MSAYGRTVQDGGEWGYSLIFRVVHRELAVEGPSNGTAGTVRFYADDRTWKFQLTMVRGAVVMENALIEFLPPFLWFQEK